MYEWERWEELMMCHYCATKFDKSIMARCYFDKDNIRWYCPNCLIKVRKNVESTPWLKWAEKITYPYRKD